MIRIERDTTKRIFTGEIPTGAGNYYLLDFYCAGSELHVYCVCVDVNAATGRPVELVVIETGDDAPVPLSGQVRLLPVGQWKLTIHEQASSTNLDPDNASAVLLNDTVYVTGEDAGAEYTGAGNCAVANVRNTDSTYTNTVASGGTLVLANVTHTDSDGSPAVLPAMTPFVATLCGAGGGVTRRRSIAIGHP